MDRELKKYLDDILNAINEIESFVSQYPIPAVTIYFALHRY